MAIWADLVPLGELGRIVSGATPATHKKEYWDGDIPWITPADLSSQSGIYFRGDVKKITREGYESCSAQMLPSGSILFSSRAPIGHCAVTAYPLCTNQGFKSIVPNQRLDPIYGFFALSYFTPQLEALGRGATFTEVNKEIVEDFRIPLPSIPDQRRIAAVLEQADRLRRLRQYALELGEGYLQSMFLEMFGDTRLNPKGWDITTLQDAGTDFAYGTSEKCYPEPIGLPVLRIPNILRGEIDLADLKYARLSDREVATLALHYGDLVFVRTNGNPEYVGRCAVFDLSVPTLFASYLIRARLDLMDLNPFFALIYLQSPAGRKAMWPYIRTTAGQSNIGIEGLGQIPIPMPPKPAQDEFGAIFRKHERLRAQQREALRQAEHLFQTLLHRAFQGEL